MHFFNPAPAMKLVEVVRTVLTGRRRARHRPRGLREDPQAPGGLRRPGRLHRERAAVPVPEQRDQDGAGALRDARRHRRRDEARRRLPDGPLRAPGRGRPRCLAGHREGAAPRVPRPGPGPGAAAGAPGGRGLPRPQDRPRLPRICPRADRPDEQRHRRGARTGAGCSTGRPRVPPPGTRAGGHPAHAHAAAHMQYVQVMSQPAKSSRTPRPRPTLPESAAGSRAAAQRLKMRRELAAAAMELFATKGYEATTVDEIAAAAGVARRTFFRHFRSKEEAIFPDHDDTLVRAEAVLNAAPAHEHPLDTVCRGIKEVMRMYAASPGVSVARYQLTREVPTLREARDRLGGPLRAAVHPLSPGPLRRARPRRRRQRRPAARRGRRVRRGHRAQPRAAALAAGRRPGRRGGPARPRLRDRPQDLRHRHRRGRGTRAAASAAAAAVSAPRARCW